MNALDLITDHPVLTVKRPAGPLNLIVAQANRAVDQLVEADTLSERKFYARHRIFAATEVLTIVNRTFGHPLAINQLVNRVERKPRRAAEGGGAQVRQRLVLVIVGFVRPSGSDGHDHAPSTCGGPRAAGVPNDAMAGQRPISHLRH